jgi:hypothetical protein
VGLRNCFVKVNTNAAYRAKFLKDPITVLKSEGVKLSAKDQKELVSVVRKLSKSLPSLGELPKGYEMVILQAAGQPPPGEAEMFI